MPRHIFTKEERVKGGKASAARPDAAEKRHQLTHTDRVRGGKARASMPDFRAHCARNFHQLEATRPEVLLWLRGVIKARNEAAGRPGRMPAGDFD